MRSGCAHASVQYLLYMTVNCALVIVIVSCLVVAIVRLIWRWGTQEVLVIIIIHGGLSLSILKLYMVGWACPFWSYTWWVGLVHSGIHGGLSLSILKLYMVGWACPFWNYTWWVGLVHWGAVWSVQTGGPKAQQSVCSVQSSRTKTHRHLCN